VAQAHTASTSPSNGNGANGANNFNASAYMSRGRASGGGNSFRNVGLKKPTSPTQIVAEITSPRQAIGGISGVASNN